MAQRASPNNERSVQGVAAFQVGFKNEQRGQAWSYKANGAITGIMVGCKGSFVGSLVFQSIDKTGNIEYSDIFGSYDEKNKMSKVILDWPQQRFTSLSCTISPDSFLNETAIQSISYSITKGEPIRLGPESGCKLESSTFEFPLHDGVIVGFYGRDAGDHITEGLGVYVKRDSTSRVKVATPETKVGSFDLKEFIKVGPWGWSRSLKEKEWTYMLKGATYQIEIGYNDKHIQSISFKTSNEKKEEFKCSQKSDTKIEKQETISLDFSEEYLVSISGTTRSFEKDIESLCFYTTKDIYGPFGPMKGNRFRFYMKEGFIVGFHGRVGNFFDALGVYIKSFSVLSGKGKNDKTEKDRAIAVSKKQQK